MPEPRLLNLVEAGERLGISERGVRYLIEKRKLKAVPRTPGRHKAKLAVSEAELQRYIDEHQGAAVAR